MKKSTRLTFLLALAISGMVFIWFTQPQPQTQEVKVTTELQNKNLLPKVDEALVQTLE